MSSVSELSSQSSAASEDEVVGASASSLLISRVVLSIAATVVLWGTSLSVVNRVVYSENVLPLPALVDVYRSAIEFVNATTREGDDYKTCVLSQLGNCNRTMQFQLSSELRRVEAEMEANRGRVALARQLEANCSRMWWSTLEAVIYWQESRPLDDDDPYDAFTAECTEEEQAYLLRSTGTVNESLKDDAYGQIEGFTGYSSRLVSDLSGQIRARKSYDDEYLANKTKAIEEINARNKEKLEELQGELDALGLNYTVDIDGSLISLNMSDFLSCNTLADTGGCPNISMRAEVEAMRQSLVDQYAEAEIEYAQAVASAEQELANLKNEANEKLEQAETSYRQMQNEAQAAMDTAQEIAGAVNALCGNSGTCGATGLPWSRPPQFHFDKDDYAWEVDAVELPSLGIDGSLPELSGGKTLDEIQAQVQATADAYEQSLAEAINATKRDAAGLRGGLAGIVPDADALDGFDDYNPPEVRLEEADNHDREAGHFLNDSRSALEGIGAGVAPEEVPEAPEPDGGGFINISGDDLKIRKPDFSFLNPQSCEGSACGLPVEAQWVVDQVGALLSMLTYLDILIRVLKQLHYLRKIWRRSGLRLDPIDMQIDAQSQNAGRTSTLSGMQGMAMLVTHPYVIGAGVAAICLVGIVYANHVYTPFFQAYELGCSPPGEGEKRTGTFFSNQAFVIAHTFAAREGNQIRVDGINQEEAIRMRTCDTYRSQTIPVQAFLEGNMSQLNGTHHKSAQGVHLMRKCYDRAKVTPPPARFPPLAESLGVEPANAACEADFTWENLTLTDAIFSGRDPAECDDVDECNQCQALLPCTVTCDDFVDDQGVYSGKLDESAFDSLCLAEYYFHAMVLRFAFTVFIFVMLNIGRFMIMAGLVRTMYRWMNTGYYSVLCSSDARGQVHVDEEALAGRIDSMLGTLQLKGLLFIGIAVLSQVVWLVGLTSYSSRMIDLLPN